MTGTWRALAFALSSRRTLAVTLLSFSSGLPLGLVWIAIPDWMRDAGVDIRVVGLATLSQAPWTFKMLWSPLLDRYAPPWLGRRRGWTALAQVALFALTLLVAGMGLDPAAPWVLMALAMAIAFASATHDIAYDAYTVEVLRPEEHGTAVGARTAAYRLAMQGAGGLSIWFAAQTSWQLVNLLLALLYLPLVAVTFWAPEVDARIAAPRTLREAVWLPFLGFLSRHRALEILAFVFCYKLADNLAQSLQRPFLRDMGYDATARGLELTLIGVFAVILGTIIGGMMTGVIGLGHALWIFGVLQIFSNVGFVMLSQSAVSRPMMWSAFAFEGFTTGTGMGAFSVLLLRLTEKRFSATQYALFSSLFGLPRILAGPITGMIVHSVGWTAFFWFTMFAGIPGLLLLQRFVPVGTREPVIRVEPPRHRQALGTGSLVGRGLCGGTLAALFALGVVALLDVIEARQADTTTDVDLLARMLAILVPSDVREWLELLGALVFGVIAGLLTAAVFAARHGMGNSGPQAFLQESAVGE